MPGTKQRSSYKKKRPRVFTGHKNSAESSEHNDNSNNDIVMSKQNKISSPAKKHMSEEKLSKNCPLSQAENEGVMTRQQSHELGFASSSKKIVKGHSNKIIDSVLLQQCISDAAICSICKSPKSKLQFWQDDSQRAGLKENFSYNVICVTTKPLLIPAKIAFKGKDMPK